MAKIIGVGSLIVDITGYAEHLPVHGETGLGQRLVFGPGGKGNNQMTAANRAGVEAIIISRMGKDFLHTPQWPPRFGPPPRQNVYPPPRRPQC